MNGTWVAPAELNIYAAAESGAALVALMAELAPGDALKIDLGQVGELDAAGMQLLLAAALAGKRESRAVEFVDVPDIVRERFARFGVATYLEPDAACATGGEGA